MDNPVIFGNMPDILEAIAKPAVQLAVWQRGRPLLLNWVDELEWDKINDIDAVITGPDYAASILRLLRDAGYPEAGPAQTLSAAISDLSLRFSRLLDLDALRMRLEVIKTDACRKFHMDYLKIRLLTTLSGTGTQWIDLGEGEEAPVNQLSCGDVGIFKGRLSVDEPAILHRSPPISGLGETRLLLVLDPAETSSKSDISSAPSGLARERIAHG